MKLIQELTALHEAKKLTAAQKAAVLADFKEWSGGFTPDMCGDDEINKYIEYAMDANLDDNAVDEFLSNYKPTKVKEDTSKKLPSGGANTEEFQSLMDAFTDYAISQDYHETAREDGPEDGAEYLMDKFEDFLQNQGFKYAEIEKFMDAHEDDVFDHIYNGLT